MVVKNGKISDTEIDKNFNKEDIKNITSLFNQTKEDVEFEFILASKKGKYLTYDKYNRIEKYLEKMGFVSTTINMLDIIYGIGDDSYRCTIEGLEHINAIMRKFSKNPNHVIMSNMTKLWKTNKHITFLKKTKSSNKTIDIDDYDLRVRLSDEKDLTNDEIKMIESLNETKMDKIFFRYKSRKTYIIEEKNEQTVKVDMTIVKQEYIFSRLYAAVPNYEVEIEYISMGKNDISMLNSIFNKFISFQKIIQQSNYIITNTESQHVLEEYRNLLNVDKNVKKLFGRQPITLEIQFISDELPNKYAVTDKADGDRCFLIIVDSKVYLISSNLDVKFTGIELDKELEKYNGSILDGEYIYITKKNRYLFMVFDCLRIGITDIRKTVKLSDRQLKGREIIDKCFVLDKHSNYAQNIKWNFENFDLDKILDHYKKDIKQYMKSLNEDINIRKDLPLIRHKYFIECKGARNWEIFAYSMLIWRTYTSDAEVKCPYMLDGLIYHPMEQHYAALKSDSIKSDFKLKPPDKNSIDFYIEFERDKRTKEILTVFDNSYSEYEEFGKNKKYQICRLYVGRISDSGEKPTLFREDDDLCEAYLFLEDGMVKDDEGEEIIDKTVVEFYYVDDPEVPDKFRWKPIRTRHDKTDSIMRFGQQYGNYYTTADSVWKSIVNPVLFSDFEDLAKGNDPSKNNYQYDKKIDSIRGKISHELIVSTTKEHAYYQVQEKKIQPMRTFHNWIKSNLIYTICSPVYKNNKQLSILDFGCGRGGDIPKYHYARAAFVVGFDYAMDGITNPYNGCRSRVNNSKKKPGFPKMVFFQGDAGSLLNVEDQKRALGGMNNENENLMKQFFSKDPAKRTMFDIISSQFAIHYLFKDRITWNNCKDNIKNYLRNGGFFIATTFNAKKIIELLGENDKYTAYYTEEETGKKKKLFEIVKKYEVDQKQFKKNMLGTGNAIDVFMSWISEEGVYLTEYLVDPRFMQKELLEDCELELVDTDGFDNQFEIHKQYITKYSKNQEDEKTRKYLSVDVASFYVNNELNSACRVWNSLMQYYVYRRKDIKNKQSGGQQKEETEFDFLDSTKFKLGLMDGYDVEYSFLNSIHQLLKSHNIIPIHVPSKELYEDVSIIYEKDNKINRQKIENVANKMIIEHTTNKDTEVKVNGLNIYITERDCNDDPVIMLYNDDFVKGRKAVILMKDGNLYSPLYKIDDDGKVRGLFNKSDPLVKWMNEQL